jgi:hypothetical protein
MEDGLMPTPANLRRFLEMKAVPRDASKFEIGEILDPVSRSVKHAENNARNHGVLSVKTANASEASKVLKQSIINNYWRWISAMESLGEENVPPFVDFMQMRWAPIGAENDPDNLNVNWSPNVKSHLRKILGPEKYQDWRDRKLVRTAQQSQGVA